MTAKTKTAKGGKTTKTATKVAKTAKVEAQLPAAQLPAQLPAAKVEVVLSPANGKPLSAAGITYHKRREAGVCVKCGKPLAEGSKLLCTEHLEYHTNWHAARKAKIDAAMALLAKQTAPVAQETVAAVVEAAPTAKVKPAPAKKQPAKKNSKK